MNKFSFIQIQTTVSSQREAEKIAQTLSKQQLAACIQIIGPILSVYRWKGRVERTKEWLCLIKTRKSLYKKIEVAIKEIHSYDLPEIIVAPILEGNKQYLLWINKETSKQ